MSQVMHRRQGGRYGGNRLEKITAPYNFVPLAREVFKPDWHETVCQDIPLPDGYCGALQMTIKSRTPILPGQKNKANGRIEHFTLPDGRLAIPGSTLRGMIRNVVEIASFGKMNLVQDSRYGVRDLTPGARSIYGDKLSKVHENKNPNSMGPFEPRTKAGWLSYNVKKRQWEISPCEFARVDKRDLAKLPTSGQWEKLVAGYIDKSGNSLPKKQYPSTIDKYEWWLARSTLKIQFDAGSLKDHGPGAHGTIRGKQKYLRYKKASNLGHGKQAGHLVFTGQPGPNKHLEFIFFGGSSPAIPVSEAIYKGFRQIYQDDPKSMAGKTYAYLKEKNFDGKGVPVFYLAPSSEIESLGLALMYRLPYENSVGELIKKFSSDHQANSFDLAELIFGTVDEENGENSLKGRISFSHARSEINQGESATQACKTILNGPKPTYYPNYIHQNETDGGLKGNFYKTCMDADARIRGWKRYPVRPSGDVRVQRTEANQSEDVMVNLNPVTDSVSYKGKMRFHNLKKEELGALIWALTWGGDPALRHAVGMGKPFGFGQVAIHIDWEHSDIIPNLPGGDPPTEHDCMNAFTTLMENWFSGVLQGDWSYSEQIVQLKAMADPKKAPGLPGELKHMSLNGGGPKNEFVLAKGAQGNKKLVLMAYVEAGREQSRTDVTQTESDSMPTKTPAENWLKQAVEELCAQHNTKEKTILLGKLLATKWDEIDDTSLKADVLALIKSCWKQYGGWEGPHSGKSKIIAYTIYNNRDRLS
ncbi:TIGR03986 family CRISPR-associated RAMP protein [Desulfosarcina ovata]|uniref:CRISPR-associated RAMP family protein n=1 Tax=Desulfosarcina ovata subsp. ovata TaxID=2752305 RepID=A0A5K8A3V7_9BACT|nr:TIGR03986 family CRISPR-associated RAMP protein [Desulfosarcina ovata]BBO87232.1 hypothetical protein DSCOOX_04120 [Desulfosarcina ovata subsp. ovata]